MADLTFSHDAGMQDGTGDGSYMEFIHKFMFILAVSTYQTLGSRSDTTKILIIHKT